MQISDVWQTVFESLSCESESEPDEQALLDSVSQKQSSREDIYLISSETFSERNRGIIGTRRRNWELPDEYADHKLKILAENGIVIGSQIVQVGVFQ